MQLENFDIDSFLRYYWQKKPCLIKNPWTAWQNPLAPDELAGLACEAEVESRLIVHENNGIYVENGPIEEARFSLLGQKSWTLLVQAVDHHVPDVAALIRPFRFIPDWRIDDIMVSIAADGGGVGAHYDQYDVFLIQGLGRRKWQVGQACDEKTPLLPHEHLRLLADFHVTDEWVLDAGDILYVPPGVAHNGVAIGDNCMTYSIGFRAPSTGELIGNWSDDILGQLTDDERYCDPQLLRQENAGEITPVAIQALHHLVQQKLNDSAAFATWLGEYLSAAKYADMDWRPEHPMNLDEIKAYIEQGEKICRNAASRFLFIHAADNAENVTLFVNGHAYQCSGETAHFAKHICANDNFILDHVYAKNDAIMAICHDLFSSGHLAFFDDIYGDEYLDDGDE
ncbi:cupin [Sphingorhabdus lutea]|uniref:Cupin n=1 Tax=Sphingorhabdus lutea TaxID=1913578 RepID=A0A1L3J8U6_9SPHN|nr:cupin domain-containing protein [Sphingorhabdus lutea]APG61559.1 cupin [Sphingorhabdus lutea]